MISAHRWMSLIKTTYSSHTSTAQHQEKQQEPKPRTPNDPNVGRTLTQRLHVPRGPTTARHPSSTSHPEHHTTACSLDLAVPQSPLLRVTPRYSLRASYDIILMYDRVSCSPDAVLVRCSPDVARQAPTASAQHARSMSPAAATPVCNGGLSLWIQSLQTPQRITSHDVVSLGAQAGAATRAFLQNVWFLLLPLGARTGFVVRAESTLGCMRVLCVIEAVIRDEDGSSTAPVLSKG